MSVLVVIVLTELALYMRLQALRRKALPPGPRPWPILGNLPDVASDMPHLKFQHLASQFGPIMSLRLGSVPCVVVSTAEAARELFRANDEYLSSRPKMLSFGILTDYKTMGAAPSPGKLWHNLRKFTSTELLSPKRVASYEGIRREELSNMMQLLLEASNKSEAINLKHWLFQTAANMATRTMVNRRIYNGNGADSYQVEIQGQFDQWLQERVANLMPPIISDYVPWLKFFSETVQGWRARIQAFERKEMALFVKMIDLDERRQRAAERRDDESYVPDFVDVMLGAPLDDGNVLEDEFIIKQVLDFFGAATETSSTTVEWAMAELFARPELMKRAQRELDTVVGLDRVVQESDIPDLPFLQAVVKETFRVHPPVPLGFPRESTALVESMGFEIPAETRIFYNIYAIQRDPAVYERPGEFLPDRFLEKNRDVSHLSAFDSYELLPFGPGRRMCPGYKLGNVVVHFILANLIHSYDWSGRVDVSDTAMIGPVLCLREPLTLVPQLRNGVPAA